MQNDRLYEIEIRIENVEKNIDNLNCNTLIRGSEVNLLLKLKRRANANLLFIQRKQIMSRGNNKPMTKAITDHLPRFKIHKEGHCIH